MLARFNGNFVADCFTGQANASVVLRYYSDGVLEASQALSPSEPRFSQPIGCGGWSDTALNYFVCMEFNGSTYCSNGIPNPHSVDKLGALDNRLSDSIDALQSDMQGIKSNGSVSLAAFGSFKYDMSQDLTLTREQAKSNYSLLSGLLAGLRSDLKSNISAFNAGLVAMNSSNETGVLVDRFNEVHSSTSLLAERLTSAEGNIAGLKNEVNNSSSELDSMSASASGNSSLYFGMFLVSVALASAALIMFLLKNPQPQALAPAEPNERKRFKIEPIHGDD